MRTAIVILLFLLLSLVLTWPLALHLSVAFDDDGDCLAGPGTFTWLGRNILTRPWDLHEAPFYHLHRAALRTGFTFYMTALIYLPLRWLSGDPVAAFNLLHLLTLALNGWAMCLLARRLTGEGISGLVCGVIFAFCPFRTANFQRISSMTNYWVTLGFLSLFVFFEAAG